MEGFLRLKKRRSKRRIIECAVMVLSLTALIVFFVLKANSRIVTTVEVTPFLSYDRAEYAKDYTLPIILSTLIFAPSVSLLLADLICARIYYSQIDGQDILVYNGLGFVRLLVDGEEKDAMVFKGFLETKLKSGVTMVVSPQFFLSYHITFSDNRPAIDL